VLISGAPPSAVVTTGAQRRVPDGDHAMPIKVLIADDHNVVRLGLASLLKDSAARICGEAATPDEAVRLARRLKPDVVLLDVRFGDLDGLDVIKKIRAAAPACRVVMFSAFDNPTYVARAVSAGAHDYVVKTATRTEIVAAITRAAEGTEPARGGHLRRMAGMMAKRDVQTDAKVPLTPRETQVLRHVAMGLSNQEIADALEISVETVKEHVQNMLRKVSLADRTQAAVWAIRQGIA
jgi:DNA-binding NarL/FixJ family response regulator